MNTKLFFWIERYLFSPNLFQICIAFLLLPLSLIYSVFITFKKLLTKKIKFEAKIISIGNLTLGGSGKTPLTKALFKLINPHLKTFIILRGYKRESKGLFIIALNGKILEGLNISGDEAMEYATTLKDANVIVSEDRIKAIKIAISQGAKVILLDDGFSKFNISKFDILLKPKIEPKLPFTIPSSGYRYPKFFYKFANFIPTNADIILKSNLKNRTKRMLLVTAIANPNRLSSYFKECVAVKIFPDHHKFSKDELLNLIKEHGATSLLVTQKDMVKISEFGINLSVIELETSISPNFKKEIFSFLNLQRDDKI